MMPHVTIPRMPMRTMTPTIIRMTLSALLLPLEGGGPGAIGWGIPPGVPLTAAPHLLQKFVPSASCAPQELQKAMVHLVSSLTGEYNAVHWKFRASSAVGLSEFDVGGLTRASPAGRTKASVPTQS